MSTLCIAVGNPLRRDDGIAHRVADLMRHTRGVAFRCSQQLMPELAEEIGRVRNVVFIDADIRPGNPYIEAITPERPGGSRLTHSLTPEEVIGLAAQLFGFDGLAFVCHVPGINFDAGEGVSAEAEANARRAVQMIAQISKSANIEIG